MALKDMIALIAQVKQLNLAQQAEERAMMTEQRMDRGQSLAAFGAYATIAPNIKDPEQRRQFQTRFSEISGIPIDALDEMGEGTIQTIAQQIAQNTDRFMSGGGPEVEEVGRRSAFNAMGAGTPEGAALGGVTEAFINNPDNAKKISLRSVLGTTPGADAQDTAIAGIPQDMFLQAWRMGSGFEMTAPQRAGLQVQREGQQIQREGQNLQAGIAGAQLNWDRIKTGLANDLASATSASEVALATTKAENEALNELREWATLFSTKAVPESAQAVGLMAIKRNYDTVLGAGKFDEKMKQLGIEDPEKLDPGKFARMMKSWRQ